MLFDNIALLSCRQAWTGISQKEKILYEMKQSYHLLHIYSVFTVFSYTHYSIIFTIQLFTLFLESGLNLKHCWIMSFTWKIFSFTPDYLPRLDHNKIISNHNAATCELSTRSIGKFTEKLISCQGHFHCELSNRGIGKFTEKLISCQGHFHYTGWLRSTIQREYF